MRKVNRKETRNVCMDIIVYAVPKNPPAQVFFAKFVFFSQSAAEFLHLSLLIFLFAFFHSLRHKFWPSDI